MYDRTRVPCPWGHGTKGSSYFNIVDEISLDWEFSTTPVSQRSMEALYSQAVFSLSIFSCVISGSHGCTGRVERNSPGIGVWWAVVDRNQEADGEGISGQK